jgi:hypothetical protein
LSSESNIIPVGIAFALSDIESIPASWQNSYSKLFETWCHWEGRNVVTAEFDAFCATFAPIQLASVSIRAFAAFATLFPVRGLRLGPMLWAEQSNFSVGHIIRIWN